MQKQFVLIAVSSLTLFGAEAKPVEYECDDGVRGSGYRIRVLELSRDVQEVIVLKKSKGSAVVVESRKLKRVPDSTGAKYESNRDDHRFSLKKSSPDGKGNWTGTFTLPTKRGARVVQASCSEIETLTL